MKRMNSDDWEIWMSESECLSIYLKWNFMVKSEQTVAQNTLMCKTKNVQLHVIELKIICSKFLKSHPAFENSIVSIRN